MPYSIPWESINIFVSLYVKLTIDRQLTLFNYQIYSYMRIINVLLPILITFSFANLTLFAQDVSFTQFYAVPYQLNPALSGTIDGSYRVGMVYRDQWHSSVDNNATTVAVGGEVKFELATKDHSKKDVAGISLFFLSDKVNGIELNTSQVSISTAYHKLLNKATNQYLGIGAQIGVFQKNINYDALDFGDEFNNINAFDLQSAEELPPNNFGVFDLSIGLNYTVKPTKKTALYSGLALHHVTTPNVSFYNAESNLNPAINANVSYPLRYVVHLSIDQQISEYGAIQPRVVYQKQGANTQIRLGTNYRHHLKGFRKAIYAGAWVSMVENTDGFGLYAISPLVGIQLGSFVVGLSYDIDMNHTFSGSAGLNNFELSFRFLGNYYNDDGFCPEF